MNNSNNYLDFADAIIDLHDFYREIQKQNIRDELMIIDKIFDDIIELRKYMATFLGDTRERELKDCDIKSLAEIRANCLFNDLRALSNNFDTLPLKIIIECLKQNDY